MLLPAIFQIDFDQLGEHSRRTPAGLSGKNFSRAGGRGPDCQAPINASTRVANSSQAWVLLSASITSVEAEGSLIGQFSRQRREPIPLRASSHTPPSAFERPPCRFRRELFAAFYSRSDRRPHGRGSRDSIFPEGPFLEDNSRDTGPGRNWCRGLRRKTARSSCRTSFSNVGTALALIACCKPGSRQFG